MDSSPRDEAAVDTDDRYHHLIPHVQDAVVEFEFVDGTPVVREVNGAFTEQFGYGAAEIVGEPLNDWIVPEWLATEAEALDEQTRAGEVNYQRVRRETATGLREFLYRGIPYTDEAGGLDGFAVYTDLTEVTRSERRIQVMNRILRHNLRNGANVIAGNTARLLAEGEPTAERTETAATVERAARELETLAEESADIQRMLDEPEVDESGIDAVPLVRQVASETRANAPTATVDTDLPEELVVYANDHLRRALDSLADNAVRHNPDPEPTVQLTARAADADSWAEIAVEDDGPMIPEIERAVVGDDADITPVRHGRGLGLWLVRWATETFGGTLSFEESDLGGNSVRLRLPRR